MKTSKPHAAFDALRTLIIFFAIGVSAIAGTLIQDTIKLPFTGQTFNGTIRIAGPTLTTAAGATVEAAVITVKVTNGLFSLNVEPNDTATPSGTSYQVTYSPITGPSYSRVWVVPTSGSAVTISSIERAVGNGPTGVTGGPVGGSSSLSNANAFVTVSSAGVVKEGSGSSSAQLANALNDETGSGLAVFNTSPILVTPVISGHATIEGVTPTGATGTGPMVFGTSPTLTTPLISGHATIEGVTPTGATGTGPMVFGTSPTIVTPLISGHPTIEGVTPTGATGTGRLVFDGSPTIANLTMSGHPTIEGVTSAGATGTGKLVFDGSPVFSGFVNAVTGYQVAGAAASGNVLRGNGTNFVSAQLGLSDLSGLPTGGAVGGASNLTTTGCTAIESSSGVVTCAPPVYAATVCDGSTDDTAAINAALAASSVVAIKPTATNNCKITATIAIPANKKLYCIDTQTKLTQATNGQEVLSITDVSNVELDNCQLAGSDSNALHVTATATNILGHVFRNVTVTAFGSAAAGILFDIASTHTITTPWLENVYVTGGNAGSRIGISFGGAGSTLTVGPVITGGRLTQLVTGLSCTKGDTVRSYGLAIDSTATGILMNCDQARMFGNRLEGNTSYITTNAHAGVFESTYATTTSGIITDTGTANTFMGSDGSGGQTDKYGTPVIFSGSITPSGGLTGPMVLTQSINGDGIVSFTNTNNGASSTEKITVGAGTTSTTSIDINAIRNSRVNIYTTGGYVLFGTASAQPIDFYTNGALHGRWNSSGGLYVGGTPADPGVGQLAVEGLKTTGAAGGKVAVCVDTATGKLYASSASGSCAN